MDNMHFKCPACGNKLHIRNTDNLFPINFKLKCKFCGSIFGFIPKIFVKADFTEHGEKKIADEEINNILDFGDEDKEDPIPIEELTSAIDELERQKNVKKEKRNS